MNFNQTSSSDLQQLADLIQEIKTKRPCAACNSNGCHFGNVKSDSNCRVCNGSGTTNFTIDQQFQILHLNVQPESLPPPPPPPSYRQQQGFENATISSLTQELIRLKNRHLCPGCRGNGAYYGNLKSRTACPLCSDTEHPGFSDRSGAEDREMFRRDVEKRDVELRAGDGDGSCACVIQ